MYENSNKKRKLRSKIKWENGECERARDLEFINKSGSITCNSIVINLWFFYFNLVEFIF